MNTADALGVSPLTPKPSLLLGLQQLLAEGATAARASDWIRALACAEQAAALDRSCAPAYRLIGDASARLERWDEAIDGYERALALDPGCADAHNNLGLVFSSRGRRVEAIEAYARAVAVEPSHANAFFNLGKESVLLGDLQGAALFFKRTLALDPDHAYAWHEWGALAQAAGLLAQAGQAYRRSIEREPTLSARTNLAEVLTQLGDPSGLHQLEALVDEQPDCAEAHWHWGMGLLLHRRFRQGWAELEWRKKIGRMRHHFERFDSPAWQGQQLRGETILLYGEQGYGDTLQFLRYVPLVVARGARVVLEVQPRLKRLLEGLPGVEASIGYGDQKPAYGCHAALMSLPHILGEDRILPPLAPRLLSPLPSAADTAQRPLQALQVGLVWSGSPNFRRNSVRSIPPAQWAALAGIEGVAFTALQVSERAQNAKLAPQQPALAFVADCRDVQDFADTAKRIAGLDLVITVDTGVAHLAGTMGKPVWILLAHAVDWRWGLTGTRTDWYPSATLFRQTIPGSWAEPLRTVAEQLSLKARLRSAREAR